MRMETLTVRIIRNVHVRRVAAPIELVGSWIETCWTGGDRDCFPHDVVTDWRRNPPHCTRS